MVTVEYKNSINLCQLKNKVKKKAQSVDSIKFTDLIESSKGVYVFLYEDEIIYVGKCSSRSFSERLAAHVSNSPDGYMNNVMKNIAWSFASLKQSKKEFLDDKNEPERTECLNKAINIMKSLKLTFITLEVASNQNIKDKIGELEKKLIENWEPILNLNARFSQTNQKYNKAPWIQSKP